MEEIAKYKNTVSNDAIFEDTQDAHAVLKSKIADNGEYNLSGDRYKVVEARLTEWPLVKLEDVVIEMKDGGTPSRKHPEYFGGDINWAVVKDIKPEIWSTSEKLTREGLKKSSAKVWPVNSIVISLGASIGHVGIARKPTATKQGLCGIVVDRNKIIPEFLASILKNRKSFIQSLASGVTIKEVRPSKLKNLLVFPLLPLEAQKEIVAEIDGYQKIIDGARQIVENWKPKIKIDPTWPMVELGEVTTEIKSGFAYGKSDFNTDGIPHLRPMNIDIYGNLVWKGTKYISQEVFANKTEYVLRKGDVLFNNTNSKELVGKTCLVNEEINCGYSNHLTRIRIKKDIVNPYYLSKLLHYLWEKGVFLEKCNKWVGQAGINNTVLSKQIKIPLPPLEVQKEIVAEIEEERKHVESSEWLIEINEEKIKDKIAEVWGE